MESLKIGTASLLSAERSIRRAPGGGNFPAAAQLWQGTTKQRPASQIVQDTGTGTGTGPLETWGFSQYPGFMPGL